MHQLVLLISATSSGAVTAVTGLNQALELLKKVASPITGLFSKIWEVGVSAFEAVYSAVESCAVYILDTFSSALQSISSEWLEFEAITVKIFNNIANEAGASMERIKAQGLIVSSVMGKDLSTTMEGLYEIIGSGFRDVTEAGQLMNSAGKLAQAGWTDMDIAIDTLITSLRSYGMGVQQADEVSAMLFQTVVQGRGKMEFFASGLARVLPDARALGFTMKDAAAAVAGVSSVVGERQTVFFAVSNAMKQLIQPTKEMSKGWEKYGFSVVKAADGTVNLKATIEKIRALRQQHGDGIISELFGNINSRRAMGALTGISKESFDTIWDSITNTQKSMQDFNSAIANTTSSVNFLLEAWAVRFQNIGVAAFDMLQSAFRPVFDDIVALLDKAYVAVEALSESAAFTQLQEHLNNLIGQFRQSNIWQSILAGISNTLSFVADRVTVWIQLLGNVIQQGQALVFFNDIAAMWNSAIDEIITVVNRWIAAIQAIAPVAQSVWGMVSDLLQVVSNHLIQFVTTDLPNMIAAWQGIDIPATIGNWLAGLQNFRGQAVEVFTEVASLFLTVFGPVINNWEQLIAAATAFGYAVASLSVELRVFFSFLTMVSDALLGTFSAIGEAMIQMIRMISSLAAKLPAFAGGDMFKGLDENLEKAEDFFNAMASGTRRSFSDTWEHINELSRKNEELLNKGGQHLDRALTPNQTDRAAGMQQGVEEFKNNQQQQIQDPNDPINQLRSYMQEQSVRYQQAQQARQQQVADLQNQETNAISQYTSQGEALFTQIASAMQTAVSLMQQHTSQLATHQSEIAQLQSMMTS